MGKSLDFTLTLYFWGSTSVAAMWQQEIISGNEVFLFSWSYFNNYTRWLLEAIPFCDKMAK